MLDGIAGQYAFDTADRLANTKAGIAAGSGKRMSDAQIDKTAKDFESVFLSQMLETMFGESLGDEMFGDSETQEIYKGMMMEEYGKQIVNSGGIGIAGYVRQELLKLQEI